MPAIDMLAMWANRCERDRRRTEAVRAILVTPNLAALPAGFPTSALLAALAYGLINRARLARFAFPFFPIGRGTLASGARRYS
jgi:hypothetical protein